MPDLDAIIKKELKRAVLVRIEDNKRPQKRSKTGTITISIGKITIPATQIHVGCHLTPQNPLFQYLVQDQRERHTFGHMPGAATNSMVYPNTAIALDHLKDYVGHVITVKAEDINITSSHIRGAYRKIHETQTLSKKLMEAGRKGHPSEKLISQRFSELRSRLEQAANNDADLTYDEGMEDLRDANISDQQVLINRLVALKRATLIKMPPLKGERNAKPQWQLHAANAYDLAFITSDPHIEWAMTEAMEDTCVNIVEKKTDMDYLHAKVGQIVDKISIVGRCIQSRSNPQRGL